MVMSIQFAPLVKADAAQLVELSRGQHPWGAELEARHARIAAPLLAAIKQQSAPPGTYKYAWLARVAWVNMLAPNSSAARKRAERFRPLIRDPPWEVAALEFFDELRRRPRAALVRLEWAEACAKPLCVLKGDDPCLANLAARFGRTS